MNYANPNALIGKKQIKLVHVAKNRLGLPDDAYRAILLGATGGMKDSSKLITFREYDKVMARFKELGFKLYFGEGNGNRMRPFTEPTGGKRKAPHARMPGYFLKLASREQQEKIYALWEDGARVKTPKALDGFVKRMTGKDSLRFITDEEAQRLIEQLKKMFGRIERKERQEREAKRRKLYDGPITGYRED